MIRTYLPTIVAIALSAVSTSRLFGQSDGATKAKAEIQIRDADREALKEAVSKSRLEELLSRAKSVRESLDKLSKEAGSFIPRLQALQTNDDGRRIALGKTEFLRFIDLEKNPVVSEDVVTAKAKALDSIIQALTDKLSDAKVGLLPPEAVRDEIEADRQWTIETLVRLETTNSWIDAAIAQAPKDVDLSRAPTLKQRIGTYRLDETKLIDANFLAGEKAAEPEVQLRMSEAGRLAAVLQAQAESDRLIQIKEGELQRMRIEYEMQLASMEEEQKEREDLLNKKLADAQAGRLLANANNQVTLTKAKDDAELLVNRQKCHDPEVVRVLQPFISNGYVQPNSGRGIDSMPMSLSALRAFGALDPGDSGLVCLMECANMQRFNDRPHWGQFTSLAKGRSSGYATDQQIELMKKARTYLNELGDALVAEQMLSP